MKNSTRNMIGGGLLALVGIGILLGAFFLIEGDNAAGVGIAGGFLTLVGCSIIVSD